MGSKLFFFFFAVGHRSVKFVFVFIVNLLTPIPATSGTYILQDSYSEGWVKLGWETLLYTMKHWADKSHSLEGRRTTILEEEIISIPNSHCLTAIPD